MAGSRQLHLATERLGLRMMIISLGFVVLFDFQSMCIYYFNKVWYIFEIYWVEG